MRRYGLMRVAQLLETEHIDILLITDDVDDPESDRAAEQAHDAEAGASYDREGCRLGTIRTLPSEGSQLNDPVYSVVPIRPAVV